MYYQWFEFDANNLLLCFLVTVGMQLFFYAIAATLKFDKVTDFAGGTNFILLAILTFILGGNGWSDGRPLFITVAVTLWGLRLAGFLLFRILKLGKDDRFDDTRENPLKFLIFWIMQMVWVLTVSLPVIFINSSHRTGIGFPRAVDIVGIVIFVLGLTVEAAADIQKFRFKDNSANRGKWCNTGLWKYSRHPNYFGEICVWIGVFTVGIPVYIDWQYVAILSPLFTITILLFVSGIPLLEKSADKRYGAIPAYRDYQRVTSPLIPLPPSLYGALPEALKTSIFCDFQFYRHVNYDVVDQPSLPGNA